MSISQHIAFDAVPLHLTTVLPLRTTHPLKNFGFRSRARAFQRSRGGVSCCDETMQVREPVLGSGGGRRKGFFAPFFV